MRHKQISVNANKNILLNILKSSLYKFKQVTINFDLKSRGVRSLYSGISAYIAAILFNSHRPESIIMISEFENFLLSNLVCYMINKKNNFNNLECILTGLISGIVYLTLQSIRDGVIANGKDWRKIKIIGDFTTQGNGGGTVNFDVNQEDDPAFDGVYNIEKYYKEENDD
jgi:hypothetical protein